MRIKKIIREQKGSAFLLALIALTAGAVLASAFLTMANSSLKISQRFDDSAKRTYAAEAGMEYAIWGLQTRSISTIALPMTGTGMRVNDCDITIIMDEKTPDAGGTPKNSMFYTITSTATDDIGKTTTITADVSTAFDMWSYALLSLDGNIDITGNRRNLLFCWTNDANDPWIYGNPTASEADIFANNGNITVTQLVAATSPTINGDAIATGSIGGNGIGRILGSETDSAIENLPALIDQQQQMDNAIVEWKNEAEFDPPDPGSPPIIAPITCQGAPACLEAIEPVLVQSTGTESVHMPGGTISLQNWDYNGPVCFDSSLAIDWASTVEFRDSVCINGNLTITSSVVRFFENASGDNTLHVTGDLTINAILAATFDSDIPVQVDGRIILGAGAGVLSATFGDDDLDTTWIGAGANGGNLSFTSALGGIAATFAGPVRIESGATYDGRITTGAALAAINVNFNQSIHADGRFDSTGMFGATAFTLGDDTDNDRFWFGDLVSLSYALLAGGATEVNGDFYADGSVTLGGAGVAVGDLRFNGTFYCTGLVTTTGFAAGNVLRFGDASTIDTITGIVDTGWDSIIVTTSGAHGLSEAIDITNVADAGSGMITVTTDVSHGLSVGDTVEMAETTLGYDGHYIVYSVPTASTFTVYDTFAGNDSGEIPADEVKIEGTDNYNELYTVLDTPAINTFEIAATFDEDETTGGNIDDYDPFYCGGNLSASGLLAGATLSFEDRVYVAGAIALSGFWASATCDFPDKVYCEGSITVTNMWAGAGVDFEDTVYSEGNLTVGTVALASAQFSFADIVYIEGTVSISGFLDFNRFTMERMIISEGNMTLNSTNTTDRNLDIEDIPLYISSGSATGVGNITMSGHYDAAAVFYAPTGTITMNGQDNDVFGSLIGKAITIKDPACDFVAQNNTVEFPEDIRQRASDLPGRVSGEVGTQVYGWKSSG